MSLSKPQDCTPYLTGTAFKQVILKYFPHQLLKDIDLDKLVNSEYVGDHGSGIIQKLIGTKKFRMYLHADYLANDMRIHRNVPSSHKYFGMDISEPYNTAVKVYESVSKAKCDPKFMVKQDIFVQIQGMILEKFKNMQLLPRSILSIFLKTNEDRLSKCHEFWKLDAEIIKEIEQKIDNSIKKITESIDNPKIENFDFEEIFENWKELVPDWSQEQCEPIRLALLAHFEKFPILQYPQMYSDGYYCSKTLIETIKEIMKAHPEMFLPYSETKTKAPPTVRVFGVRQKTFVMKSELYAALNSIAPSRKFRDYKDPDGFLMAIEYDDVDEEFGKLLERLDIIITPLPQTSDKKAFLIMSPDGDYCTLAGDALLEVVTRTIYQRKLFQRIKKDYNKHVEAWMNIVRQFFTEKMKTRYFIKLSAVEKCEEQLDVFCKKFEKINVNDVRNVGKDGFDLKFLKFEMNNLGLTKIFPMICQMAECNLNEALKEVESKELLTWNLFHNVEKSQIDCLMHRLPEFYRFLHTQQEPHMPCELCESPLLLLMAGLFRLSTHLAY